MAAAIPALAAGNAALRGSSPLPGFGLALGVTLTALSPALVLKAASAGPADIIAIATSPRTLAALKLSALATLALKAFLEWRYASELTARK